METKEELWKRINDNSIYFLCQDQWGSTKCIGHYTKRGEFTAFFSWAVPSYDAINKIKEFANGDTILEIGAVLGLWAKLLELEGAKIIATEPRSDGYKHNKLDDSYYYFNCHKLNYIESLDKFKDLNILMLCWPPYDTEMAFNTLEKFTGNKFIYVGEINGCNATDSFFSLLDKEWKEMDEISIPQWWGIHDVVKLYERLEEKCIKK